MEGGSIWIGTVVVTVLVAAGIVTILWRSRARRCDRPRRLCYPHRKAVAQEKTP